MVVEQTQVVKETKVQIGMQGFSSTQVVKEVHVEVGKQVNMEAKKVERPKTESAVERYFR